MLAPIAMSTCALATDWDLSAAGQASLTHVQAACISFVAEDGLVANFEGPSSVPAVENSDSH